MNSKFNIKKENFILLIPLTLIVSISQLILASKHLQMGFFTDDWLFLSIYQHFVTNPFLDIGHAWKEIGSHNFGYTYYLGVLYNFFGLDYFSYRLTNQILKIIATLSLYPLILYLFKNKLLAFLSTLIYAIHFSPFGLLDGPSRGGDFVAIASMNIFLLLYLHVAIKRIFSIPLLLGLAVLLFTTILLGPTRLFPLLAIVPFIEGASLFTYSTMDQVRLSLKRLTVLFSPMVFLFIFSPDSISVQLSYATGLFEKIINGNWQLFLIPFSALGSTYIPRSLWPILGYPASLSFSSYLEFFFFGPIFLFTILSVLIMPFISSNPIKFIIRSLLANIVIGFVVYIINQNWHSLNPVIRTPVDPSTFLIPAIIGLFIVSTAFFMFLEWIETKNKQNLFIGFFLGTFFATVFITLTWVFADVNSVFTGVHAYLNIPSIGTSVFLATAIALIYKKLSNIKASGKLISTLFIVIVLISYFKISAQSLDTYFSDWLANGLDAQDQERIRSQFWKEIEGSRSFNINEPPLIYFGSSEEYENGAYYSEVIVWRLASWYDLKFSKTKEKKFELCNIEILGKEELEKFVTLSEDGENVVNSKCGEVVYKKDNFFAFRFKDRNLIPNTKEILKSLETR